ncbi:MAG: hypothetical protein ABWX94_03100, partial [Candidatus Saccharimonadales bacterium]
HKRLAIPGTIVVLVAILAAIPLTRYPLAGLVFKQTFTVRVLDSETNKPVTSADVTVAGRKVQTDSQGQVKIDVRVGNTTLLVEKKYYEKSQQKTLVPIMPQKKPVEIKVKATGRQVTVTLLNKISQKPIENGTITALDTKANTDKDGKAVLVLPADKQTVDAVISANGYNEVKQVITVSLDEKVNQASLTPAGSVYFLSDSSGKLDVVKSDLDGGNRKVVVAGTGKEDKRSTVLLASRDWKYLTLHSKRDGGEFPKLFLIDTSNDAISIMDEGAATFTLTGWSDHRFVYAVDRQNLQNWQQNKQALKTYDATNKKISTIDQTNAEGDANYNIYNTLGTAYILKNEIVYPKSWFWQGSYPGWNSPGWETFRTNVLAKKAELKSIKPDGTGGRTIKSYGAPTPKNPNWIVAASIDTRLYEPQGIWIQSLDSTSIEEYEDGQVKAVQGVKADQFWDKEYTARVVSPDGNNTFWSEPRDGKNTLIIGDEKGNNSQEIAKLSDYSSYGWFTDQYLLVSKNGSELYILPVAGGTALKLTDYYKPYVNFSSYGYGYGGL